MRACEPASAHFTSRSPRHLLFFPWSTSLFEVTILLCAEYIPFQTLVAVGTSTHSHPLLLAFSCLLMRFPHQSHPPPPPTRSDGRTHTRAPSFSLHTSTQKAKKKRGASSRGSSLPLPVLLCTPSVHIPVVAEAILFFFSVCVSYPFFWSCSFSELLPKPTSTDLPASSSPCIQTQ